MAFSDPRAGRRAQPGMADTPWLVAAGTLGTALVLAAVWGAVGLATAGVPAGASLVDVFVLQGRGTVAVSVWQIVALVAAVLMLALLGLAGWKVMGGGSSSRVDHLARSMSSRKDFREMGRVASTKNAARLHADAAGPGVPLAKLTNGGQMLFASWEWVQTWIMGPRAGKTTCVCVPQIVETNGPVLATSNKRDIVDLTRGPRSEKGVVWVHDVQGIIGEPASWWWNPLSFVTSMERAEALTDVFVTSSTSVGAKSDAYFEADGKRLLSHMFYAAAVAHRPITDVFRWAQDPEDESPVRELRAAGHPDLAESLSKIQRLTPKQRDGVYGTCRPWVNVLSYEAVIPWIRDTGQVGRAEFDHREFVKTTDTLYLISKEGAGTARAITGALTMALLMDAEEYAALKPAGRLSPPLMGVLDEVANVCRWSQLPDVYSHYGSRGIVLSSFFQGWDQGVEAFGKEGMRKLWNASNVRVAGSGLQDSDFLPFLSQVVGDRDVVRRTSSTQQRGGRSVSTSVQRERILDVSDLAAMPRGRAVMSTSGVPAALISLEHFSAKPYAQKMTESQRYYESHMKNA
ncbi:MULTISPECIES: type IV secretory system conjugative DNA transfer family protein [Micrococcaceae]|uniref:type IV secretory system conjugative DNA transfer family protein n=1 Tax=Micrococcaceae TaxID=1268 RepID=UPI001C8DA17E|nr:MULTISPECIES: type IV secretory system conjugative DNA transfer family protein [Micrococcaceae]MBY0170658.1 TraM recognition domain-containing protein [Micrococcus luteus]